MHGDLSALVKSAKRIRQNRLTHLCVAVVNRLGNSSSHQLTHSAVGPTTRIIIRGVTSIQKQW